MLKEHKDSIRALSLEYARLSRENQELRAIIKGNVYICMKLNDFDCISHFPHLSFQCFLAGQEALSVLDESEEVQSLEVDSGNGNESMTNGKEQPSKKITKKT